MSHPQQHPSAPDDGPPSYEAATSGSNGRKDESAPLAGGYSPKQQSPYHSPYPPSGPGGYPSQPYPPPGGHGPSTGYPQEAGYPPSHHTGHQQHVIIQQPTAAPFPNAFYELPVQVICPSCNASVQTGVMYETGVMAWVACVILCLVGCDAGCCLIPFCADSCKDAVHICPNCQHTIGRYNRL